MRLSVLAFAAALAAPLTAFAAETETSSLTLQSADGAPARTIIDGAVWKCQGASCQALGGQPQSADRACRRIVARLGKVTAFTWRGTSLSGDALAACNGN